MSVESVFMLHHGYGQFDALNLRTHKLLGCFAKREEAEAAVSKYVELPGFREQPDGYSIDEFRVRP